MPDESKQVELRCLFPGRRGWWQYFIKGFLAQQNQVDVPVTGIGLAEAPERLVFELIKVVENPLPSLRLYVMVARALKPVVESQQALSKISYFNLAKFCLFGGDKKRIAEVHFFMLTSSYVFRILIFSTVYDKRHGHYP